VLGFGICSVELMSSAVRQLICKVDLWEMLIDCEEERDETAQDQLNINIKRG
jgi:hypothetical protein